ncbi:hypothetical protein EC08BKT55439_5066 [Escherichia coli 08BKT055439]|uniref:Uncharacterized protein n=2 Tax=Escherichia coli TaxID=562 RepID=A0A192CH08_ECO25|nr:hypothetical protein ECH74115_5760 [Escherichia coli O157:H7 str. EC4115]AIG71727.1 hypothetical protein EDL933_5588 [Escherichia coli O157:H7 str. EDL933]AJA29390.1 hypothetical protein SS52_5618 [Escherichia coli O157:H7 str. SS52]ANK05017.1 Hypothetical protein WLH_03756 [Escherichia coli O25b:H4]ASL61802.1 hypothetical protein FORC44_5049 [Escherichia coli]EDU82443.1 hypothetical protein ECH7EC4486_1970 [Escherichia coli O157:H7 str. EC4486]EDU87415.1 hypothetical protein ECH7EC4501_27
MRLSGGYRSKSSLSPGNAGHSGVLSVSMLFLLIFQPANSLKNLHNAVAPVIRTLCFLL